VTSLLEAKAEVNTVTDVRTPTTRTWEYQYWYWGVRRRDLRKVFSNCFSYQIDCNTCLVADNFDFSRNQAGQTPLMMAADAGQTSVVTLLLAAKAQVNLANSVSYRHIYIYIRMFLRFPSAILVTVYVWLFLWHVLTLWHGTASYDPHALIRLCGFHFTLHQSGKTALFQASFAGHLSVVSLLLSGGAEIDAADQVRYSAVISCQALCRCDV
jgi:Ankyrin repeat